MSWTGLQGFSNPYLQDMNFEENVVIEKDLTVNGTIIGSVGAVPDIEQVLAEGNDANLESLLNLNELEAVVVNSESLNLITNTSITNLSMKSLDGTGNQLDFIRGTGDYGLTECDFRIQNDSNGLRFEYQGATNPATEYMRIVPKDTSGGGTNEQIIINTEEINITPTVGATLNGSLTATGNITCNTLNYTTLNPPVSASQTLAQVLTTGNDASNNSMFSLQRIGVGVNSAGIGDSLLNISPIDTTSGSANACIRISPTFSMGSTNPNIYLQNNQGGTATGFCELGCGTVFSWLGFKSTEALSIGTLTGTNGQSFGYICVFNNTPGYSGYNQGITAGGTTGTLPFYGSAFTPSDERVKTDIIDLDDEECLNMVRNLQPKRYKYVGEDIEQVGYIAQNVKEYMPFAVNTCYGTTRNYYENVNFIKVGDNYEIELTKEYECSVNDILQLKQDDSEKAFKILSIDGLTLLCEGIEECQIEGESGTLFLIGKRVNDFNYIKNNASIDAVLTSAIQEVDRTQRKNKIYRKKITLEDGTFTDTLENMFSDYVEMDNIQVFLQNNTSFSRVRGSVNVGVLDVICEDINDDIIDIMIVGEINI